MPRAKPTKRKPEFYEWVTTLRDGENPRGDFIRDTRFLFELGGESRCEEKILRACGEAKQEKDLLRLEYDKAKAN